MQPDKVVKVAIGEDMRDVIRLKDGDYDFYFEEVDGYKNADSVTVGKLVHHAQPRAGRRSGQLAAVARDRHRHRRCRS